MSHTGSFNNRMEVPRKEGMKYQGKSGTRGVKRCENVKL